MERITVIIPNYNGLKFMGPCMSALAKQTCRDFCVLAVDNGSADGSAEKFREWEKEAPGGVMFRALYLPENTGFSGAVNAGLSEVKTEFAVLLNNDTEVYPEYLEKMLAVMTKPGAEKTAAVSPLMLSLKDPTIIDSAGDGYCLVGWAFQRGVGQKADVPKFSRQTGIFSACAGAAMYRKSALDEVRREDASGGWWFDPAHFAYLEDVDVSWRLLLSGYNIVYEPAAKVLHAGSATSGSRYNDFKVRLAARNNVWLNVKNQPVLQLIINLPFLLAGVLVKQLFFVVCGFGKSYFHGFLEGISGIPGMWPKKVRVTRKTLPQFFRAEFFMITDMFSYLGDLLRRKFFCREKK